MKVIGLIFLSSLLVLSCTTKNSSEQKKNSILTQKDAQLRFEQIRDIHYDLEFDFSNAKENDIDFTGISKIFFQATSVSDDLRIDFFKGSIKNIQVNGEAARVEFKQSYFFIPKKHLKKGKNLIEISFSAPFSTSGDGLHRTVDPEDKSVYLYTNLEPYDANKVFPCFDQPDLKATYKTTVKGPKNWQVVSSVLESKVEESEKFNVWYFPISEKFSTYVWSLHAGPYFVWNEKFKHIPMRLYARKTLAKYVKSADWFKTTKYGLNFFQEYFAYPYPYKKYDQIIVPDFNPGAMENVAAVTFNEKYVSKGEKSRALKNKLANVILHEMAHMWFGNLVTMKWWNDLWLNESFATFMASLAMENHPDAQGPDETWKDFYGTKRWAYYSDSSVTTHAIEAPVETTEDAFTNFDGITYGKGASLQKQLNFYLGRDNFKKGIQKYFNKYAEKNTTLAQFLAELQSGSEKDLGVWSEQWLKTPGLNAIQVKFDCDNGKLTSFSLDQTAPKEYPKLKEQKTNIALYKVIQGVVEPVLNQSIVYSGATTKVNSFVGQDCPVFVYPNANDHAYAKVYLDSTSIAFFEKNFSMFKDEFLLIMVWDNLWQMVRDGKLSVFRYSDLVYEQLRQTKSEKLLRQLAATVGGRAGNSPSVMSYLPLQTDREKEIYLKLVQKYENLAWNGLNQAGVGSDLQKEWFFFLARVMETPKTLKLAESWLSGEKSVGKIFKTFPLDQDKRWQILSALCALGSPGAVELLEQEKKKDPSVQGQENAIFCEAALPNEQTKKLWLKEAHREKSEYKFSQLRSALYGLFPGNQRDFRSKLSKDFYENLTIQQKRQDQSFLESFLALAPFECEEKGNLLVSRYLQKNGANLLPAVKKGLLRIEEEQRKCGKILSLARSSL